MKIIIIFLLAITAAFAQKQKMTPALEQEAITAMTEEIQKVVQQYASASAKGLLKNATGKTGYEFWTCTKANLDLTLQGLPQKVIDKFNFVKYSQSTEFQTFSISIKQNYSYVYDFIGTAKSNSTDVSVGIAFVASYGITSEPKGGFSAAQENQIVDFLTEIGYKVLLKYMPKIAASTDNYIEMEFIHNYYQEDEEQEYYWKFLQ